MARTVRSLTVFLSVAGILLATGCGYARNVRDDVMDLVDVSVGLNLPRIGSNPTPFRPPIGLYVEATDFLHLGMISRAGADIQWDRRGLGTLGDVRTKVGLGPWHSVRIEQIPWTTNAYKRTGNKLDGWREHLGSASVGRSPAKELIFTGEKSTYFHKGWQDFAHVSMEAGLFEPLLLRLGVYVRLGMDPAQATDLLFSMLLLDPMGDDAFRFWNGRPKY